MVISKNFSLEEFTQSATATANGINNIPLPNVIEAIKNLVIKLLQPLRDKWGKPITVISGYRCPELNKKVGGATTSQHVLGEAADITTGNKKENEELFKMILSMGIEFDQLIDEKGYQWIHISLKKSGNRRQVLKL